MVEGDAIDIAEQRGRNGGRRFDRPDVPEEDVADGGVGLLDLHQRIPVFEADILEAIAGGVSSGAVGCPYLQQCERNAAGSDAGVDHIRIAQSEIAAVEDLLGPGGTDDVRDAGRQDAVFDGDIGDVVAGRDHRGVVVPLPIALHGEDIIGGADEDVAHQGVAAAEPIHAVLVGIGVAAPDNLDVVEGDGARVLHLDHPGATTHHASDAADRDIACVVHDDAVPVGLVLPAGVIVGVLGPS